MRVLRPSGGAWPPAIFAIAAGLASVGCPSAKEPRSYGGAAQGKVSQLGDRTSVAVTVYNQGFGVVREVRKVDLGKGLVSLEFRDVASAIEPQTVHVKSLTRADALEVMEQDYRYDLLGPEKLLEKYVGKKVKIRRYDDVLGTEDVSEAEVLSVEGSPVFRLGDEITFGVPGRIMFPELPADLIAEPTLVWLLGSDEAKQDLEVTYRTRGLSWHADYIVRTTPKNELAQVTGWVTLNNDSGATFHDAKLKLVAGDVQIAQPAMEMPAGAPAAKSAEIAEKKPFKEESFFEYHLYSLERQTDLLDKEQKQVELLEAADVKTSEHLVVNGSSYWYRNDYGNIPTKQAVQVFLAFQNEEKNHMGMPLPKGVVRVYRQDASGADQFVGEDAIDHTPRDEEVKVKLGEAFDVAVDRKRTDFKILGECWTETAWELDVRNHKDVPATVELVEPSGGEWNIVTSSMQYVKKDQTTFEFDPVVPAKGEQKVTYRVRIKWC